MIVQEPVQATIWFQLNHFAFNDAIFLAERLYSEVCSEDALYLLATCYLRAGKTISAYSILSKRNCKEARCRFLLAKCCADLKKYSEAEEALLCSFPQFESKQQSKCVVSTDEMIAEFGESASFVAQLLGLICAKSERVGKALDYYKKSLKLNPFLWDSFVCLVQLGCKLEPNKIFDVANINFSLCHGINPLVSLVNNSEAKASDGGCAQPAPLIPAKDLSQSIPGKFEINSPFAVIKSASDAGTIDVLTPDNSSWTSLSLAPPKLIGKIAKKNYLGTVTENSPSLPFPRSDTPTGYLRLSFGVFPLGDVQPAAMPIVSTTPSEINLESKTPSADNAVKIARAPVKRQAQSRRNNSQGIPMTITRSNAPKSQPGIFSQSGNNNVISESGVNQATGAVLSSQASSQPGNLRRSTRLFNSSSSVKENSKNTSRNQENNKGSSSTKTPTKKTKKPASVSSLNASVASIQQKESEINEINKPEQGWTGNTLPSTSPEELVQAGLKMQKASAGGLMNLLQELGKALTHLGQYHSHKAIDVLKSLPEKHLNSGWVLVALGRAYFELGDYEEACKYYDEAHQTEPHRLQGMEYYSTALWHLQREVQLSMLSQELIEFDKNSPQSWCVAGNCFSLQKEHETAIKFLQRAIQVDTDFAYAYTLLGHELILTEEMDHAMACFRNAIRIDPRHYNAWCGIGSICYKQEKYQLAETHYRKAHEISSYNPALLCHLGVVQGALKKYELALQTFDKSIELATKKSGLALCKFHRASHYFKMDKHAIALSELEQLKQLTPKESLVYFLTGKIHKRLGNQHMALMNFSWAMDLDPKGANNGIKEVIDRQYANDEDEVVVCLDSSEDAGLPVASSSGVGRRSQPQFELMEADNEPDEDNSFNQEVSI